MVRAVSVLRTQVGLVVVAVVVPQGLVVPPHGVPCIRRARSLAGLLPVVRVAHGPALVVLVAVRVLADLGLVVALVDRGPVLLA